MAWGNVPFGLRQVKLYNSDGSSGVALPKAMMLRVAPKFESATFAAGGRHVAASTLLVGAEWELEQGGLDLDTMAKLLGLGAVEDNFTPNRTYTLTTSGAWQPPYVRIYGRTVGDGGDDDVLCRLYRCKVTALEGTYRRGEFWVSYCAGVAVHSASGIMDFVQRETGAAI